MTRDELCQNHPSWVRVGERSGSRIVTAITQRGKHGRVDFVCDCGGRGNTQVVAFRKSPRCRKCHIKPTRRKYTSAISTASYELYGRWTAMRHRCRPTNKTDKHVLWHGRGIKVCDEWENSFETFEKWALANGYAEGLSIDRVDNDGNYEPNNCEWVTRSENSKRARRAYVNVRKSKMLCFYDEASYGDF